MGLPLEGKVAIVTGSSRGIDKVLALRLAEDGADIECGPARDERELLLIVIQHSS